MLTLAVGDSVCTPSVQVRTSAREIYGYTCSQVYKSKILSYGSYPEMQLQKLVDRLLSILIVDDERS